MKRVIGLSAALALAATLSLVAVAQAQVTTNISVPFAGFGPEFVPCANGGSGEDVVGVGGQLHILLTDTVNGNSISGTGHFQPQGGTLLGTVTGDIYRATGVTRFGFRGSLVNGQFETTFINNFRLIGPGPGNNLLLHETFHVTINANGVATAFVDNLSVECR